MYLGIMIGGDPERRMKGPRSVKSASTIEGPETGIIYCLVLCKRRYCIRIFCVEVKAPKRVTSKTPKKREEKGTNEILLGHRTL